MGYSDRIGLVSPLHPMLTDLALPLDALRHGPPHLGTRLGKEPRLSSWTLVIAGEAPVGHDAVEALARLLVRELRARGHRIGEARLILLDEEERDVDGHRQARVLDRDGLDAGAAG